MSFWSPIFCWTQWLFTLVSNSNLFMWCVSTVTKIQISVSNHDYSNHPTTERNLCKNNNIYYNNPALEGGIKLGMQKRKQDSLHWSDVFLFGGFHQLVSEIGEQLTKYNKNAPFFKKNHLTRPHFNTRILSIGSQFDNYRNKKIYWWFFAFSLSKAKMTFYHGNHRNGIILWGKAQLNKRRGENKKQQDDHPDI